MLQQLSEFRADWEICKTPCFRLANHSSGIPGSPRPDLRMHYNALSLFALSIFGQTQRSAE
jgi:hypothetical protein